MLKRRQIFIRFREVSSVRGIFRVQRLIHLYGFARGPVRLANAKKHLNVAGGRRVYFLFPRSVLSSSLSLSLSRILSPPDNCLNIQIYYTRHTHTHMRARTSYYNITVVDLHSGRAPINIMNIRTKIKTRKKNVFVYIYNDLSNDLQVHVFQTDTAINIICLTQCDYIYIYIIYTFRTGSCTHEL